MPFIPHTADDVARMLEVIGAPSIEDLFDEIPAALKAQPLDGVPPGLCEMDIARLVTERAAADGRLLNFIGAGAYEHHIPAPVWAIATRGEFYSAYTPYQAEASQGTLTADLRVPVDDLHSHGHGSRQRLAVRRCVLARRGLPDGRALQPRLDLAPHPHAAHRQPDLPQGRAVDHTASGDRARDCGLRACIGALVARCARGSRRRGLRRAGGATAELLRQPGRDRPSRRLGARPQCARHRGRESHLARLAESSGRVGRGQGRPLGRRHRVRRRTAARRAARLGRSVLRLHGDAPAIRATDAGTDRRTNLGRGRAARLHADPAGARAAHPPQQGHLQHLHQPGADGDGGDDLHVAPRRRGSRGRRERERTAHPRAGRCARAARRSGAGVQEPALPRGGRSSSIDPSPRCSRRSRRAVSQGVSI